MSILDGLTDATKHAHVGKSTTTFKSTDPLDGQNLTAEEIEHHRKYDAGKKVVEFDAKPHEDVLGLQKDLAAKKAVELPKDEAALKAHNEGIAKLEAQIKTESQFAHARLDGHAADIAKSREHLTAIEKQYASHTANAARLEEHTTKLNAELKKANAGHTVVKVTPGSPSTLKGFEDGLKAHNQAKLDLAKLSKTSALAEVEAVEQALTGFVPSSETEVAKRLAAVKAHVNTVTPHLENVVKSGESAMALHAAGVTDLSKEGLEAAGKKFSAELAEKRGFLDGAEKAVASARTELSGATGIKEVAAAVEASGAKMFSLKQVGNNWSKGGFAGKAQVGIGSAVALGFGVSGAKDVLTGMGFMSAGQNPDGTEQEAGGIFSGAAKLAAAAGGLWLAGRGGHAR